MDMIFQEFLDIYPDLISKIEKGYNILSYIHKMDIYPKDIYPTRCCGVRMKQMRIPPGQNVTRRSHKRAV